MTRPKIYFLSEGGKVPFNEFLRGCAKHYKNINVFADAVSIGTGVSKRSVEAYIYPWNKDGSSQVPPEDRFRKIAEFLGYSTGKFELSNVRNRPHTSDSKEVEILARRAAEIYIQRDIKNFSTTFFRSLSREHEKLYGSIDNDFPAFVDYVRNLGYEIKYTPQKQNRKSTKRWSEKEIAVVTDVLRNFGLNGLSRKGCLSTIKEALESIGSARSKASIMYMIDELRKYKKPNLFEHQFSGNHNGKEGVLVVPADALDKVLTIPEYLGLHLHNRIERLSRRLDNDYSKALSSDRLSDVNDFLTKLGSLIEKYDKKNK